MKIKGTPKSLGIVMLTRPDPLLGYCVFLGGNIFLGKLKQNVVTRLTAEAEYRTMKFLTYELIWVKNSFKNLTFVRLKKARK